jgi:hypothetical protein
MVGTLRVPAIADEHLSDQRLNLDPPKPDLCEFDLDRDLSTNQRDESTRLLRVRLLEVRNRT